MAVRIVTNSSSDIPRELAAELGITVVPEYVVFGNKAYKDRIDISEDEFYDKLVKGKIQPTTSNPNPGDFVAAYNEVGKTADGIVSIHISTKLSGTVNSAMQARKETTAKCPIEIIDSKLVAIPLGMVVAEAARMAKQGKGVQEIADATRANIERLHLLAAFDTLEYLARGGRIGKAKAMVGALLNVKPMLTIKDGELVPAAQARSMAKAKEKLVEFASSFKDTEELWVIYSTDRKEAQALAKQINGFPQERIGFSRLGTTVGTHAGPGLLGIALRTKS
jgi:DegV family protein with EDD domain